MYTKPIRQKWDVTVLVPTSSLQQQTKSPYHTTFIWIFSVVIWLHVYHKKWSPHSLFRKLRLFLFELQSFHVLNEVKFYDKVKCVLNIFVSTTLWKVYGTLTETWVVVQPIRFSNPCISGKFCFPLPCDSIRLSRNEAFDCSAKHGLPVFWKMMKTYDCERTIFPGI